MLPEQLIVKIMASKRPSDVFTGDWQKEYRDMMIMIHPDRCKLPNAAQASAKLGEYKMLKETGVKYIDDSGAYHLFDDKAVFKETPDIQRIAYNNWQTFMSMKDSAAKNFQRYLPSAMGISGDVRTVTLDKHTVSMDGLVLPQEHVNWVISRVFELISWYSTIGYSSCSILPNTILIVPETHGIVHTSLYHMTKIPNRVQSISAQYKSWYPTSVFNTKRASKGIDLYMAKRLAAYLLGDKSGDGAKLKRDPKVNPAYIDFILTSHQSSYVAFQAYRQMLRENFDTKKFHPLAI